MPIESQTHWAHTLHHTLVSKHCYTATVLLALDSFKTQVWAWLGTGMWEKMGFLANLFGKPS